jgi:alcohol dehydrogenase class IV
VSPVDGSFRHLGIALRVHQGPRALQALPAEIARAGSQRVLVVCGGTLARDEEVQSRIRKALGTHYVGIFGGAQPHCPVPVMLEAVDALRSARADGVLALGGGSAIVTARAASIVLAEGSDVHALCTRRSPNGRLFSPRLCVPKLPQFVVPSTPTAACAKAGSAVQDPVLGERLALFDPKTRPAAVFVDPGIALTAPEAVVRSAAVYSFCAALQGLESRHREPFSDALLLHAATLLGGLSQLSSEPLDAALRCQLIDGALLAGLGTEQTAIGLASALSHSLGLIARVDQAQAIAVLTPHTLHFNETALDSQRRMLLSQAVRAATPHSSVVDNADRTAGFFSSLGLPVRLRNLGVNPACLQRVADHAMGDWYAIQNPRPPRDGKEMLALLEAAW